jgi:hypothetical protein
MQIVLSDIPTLRIFQRVQVQGVPRQGGESARPQPYSQNIVVHLEAILGHRHIMTLYGWIITTQVHSTYSPITT